MLTTASTLAPPRPPEDATGKRPCPYCGVWNRLEFAFCQKCGRPLPPLEETTPPAATLPPLAAPPAPQVLPPPPSAVPSAWSTPPPPPGLAAPVAEVEDTPAFDRPLTESESATLRKVLQSQRVKLPRFLAFFVGIMPLAMIGMAAAGTPFIPANYMAIVLVTSVLALILGGIAQGARTPIVKALARGTAREVRGVPQVHQATGVERTVSLGGLTFRMRGVLADRLLPERMNRIVYVEGMATKGPRRPSGWLPILVLDWSGQPAARPDACLVNDSGRTPEAAATPPGTLLGAVR